MKNPRKSHVEVTANAAPRSIEAEFPNPGHVAYVLERLSGAEADPRIVLATAVESDHLWALLKEFYAANALTRRIERAINRELRLIELHAIEPPPEAEE